jgi:hypothetical protein
MDAASSIMPLVAAVVYLIVVLVGRLSEVKGELFQESS